VEACPPSTAYRVKKFVSRHRALALGTALVVLALVSGVIGTTWGLVRALAAEKTAREESLRADGEKQKAVAAEADTRAFSDFLLFQVLAAARLKGDAQRVPITTTIAQSIAEAEKGIDERFQDRPTAEADVRHALGLTWRNLGRFAAAEKHFRRALELRRQHLGVNAPRTLSSQRCLGATLDEAGRTAEGLLILEDALTHHRAVLGSDNKETLLCLDNLAAAYARAGRLGDALGLQTEALERGRRTEEPDGPDMLRRLSNLAGTYTKLNRPADAVPLLEKALQGMKQMVGPTHRETLLCMNRLAEAYSSVKAFNQSIPLFEELLALEKKVAGMHHPDTLRVMQSLAVNYAEAGRVGDLRRLTKDYLDREPLHLPTPPSAGDLPNGPVPAADGLLVDLVGALGWLVQLYNAWGKKDQANEWRKKLDEARAAPRAPAGGGADFLLDSSPCGLWNDIISRLLVRRRGPVGPSALPERGASHSYPHSFWG
jgi:tetratricopeptide (TPR) repeat protein